ncbi:MAG: dihydroorotate dehydrogenase electron transfer subunit [Bacteroides sp.]|nr:dihydroorotate dehydrogenase electron transfer subunit [Bacteroides sp.]MCM1094740.1 dihydroorotate dehydrogenase electron transfer subunit [Terasakiella sp.]
MTKQLLDLRIVSRRRLPGGMWHLVFSRADGEPMPAVLPGQFAQIRIDGTLLRRPISISDVPDPMHLHMLVRPVGDATSRLCSAAEGSVFNVLLPLGRGFSPAGAGDKVLLVGGGVGCAPLVMLCRSLVAAGAEVTVAIGGRTAADVDALPEMYPGARVAVSTDDGSRGHHGLVTTLPEMALDYSRIYTCGPTPMMKAVARLARERGIDCEVSLENMMACGLGACLCCIEKTVEGNVCVCTEGPVFNINRLTWQ